MRSIPFAVVAALAVAGLGPVGCGGSVTGTGSPATGDDGGAGDGASGSSDASHLAGNKWTGYFESYKLPSGSDHVALALDVAADGTVTGTAVLGDPPLLAPPTDPNLGYPPAAGAGAAPDTLEHFEFSVRKGRLDGGRLTFKLNTKEIFKQWCEIQTKIYPVFNGTPAHELLGYGCLPNAATGSGTSGCFWHDDVTNMDVSVDCNKLRLCMFGQGPCTCTMTSCTADVTADGDVAFDLAVNGDAANGTAQGLSTGQNINVHLTRMP